MNAEQIHERLRSVQDRIASVGVDPAVVKIVAVTKKFDASVVQACCDAGLADVGENYAQEARAKADQLAAAGSLDATWHFIGQLQTNKVRSLVGFIDTWHSIDSQSQIEELARRQPGAKVLVQVNLAGTERRGGCGWDEIEALVTYARKLQLGVAGLSGVAPLDAEDQARALFRQLARNGRELGLAELSMGMSGDYPVAVEEGATIIRLGTALLGPRQ